MLRSGCLFLPFPYFLCEHLSFFLRRKKESVTLRFSLSFRNPLAHVSMLSQALCYYLQPCAMLDDGALRQKD
jgi:hypothetical protein